MWVLSSSGEIVSYIRTGAAMWTDEEVRALKDMAERLDVDPRDLVKLMCHESGCSPAAINWIYERDSAGKIVGRHAGAVGLIQFEPDTLHWEGWNGTQEAFSALPVLAQLPYVERYFRARKAALDAAGDGLGALYTATFLPKYTAGAWDPNEVLCRATGDLAWAYRANAGFDTAHKGYITVGDMVRTAEAAFAKNVTGQAIVAALDAME